MPEIRCFIAIDIPEDIKNKIIKLNEELDIYGIKTVKQENLHITLKFLEDVADTKLSELERKLRKIYFSPFNIRLRIIGVFPNEHDIKVIWIGCKNKELCILAKKINECLADQFKKEEFTAHLTIGRVKQKVEIRKFLDQHKNDYFGNFICNKFELKKSQLTRDGPIYSILNAFEAKS